MNRRSGSADTSERNAGTLGRKRTGGDYKFNKIETPTEMEEYRRAQGLPARTIVPLPSSRTTDGQPVPMPKQPGNIDLSGRKPVRLSDGSIATIRSLSFNDGRFEVVIPTIGPNGEDLSDDEAISMYEQTGKHLGKFADVQSAETYAQWLHEEEERRVDK